ncbi:MAG TPA: LytTR family transcriptional regulator [Clostridiaceae bacterium]|nr:LytTR family transcriptional regulator [Clostridiaceae bacterium]
MKELDRQKPVWIIETESELFEVRIDHVSHIEAEIHQTILTTRRGVYTTCQTLATWRECIESAGVDRLFISPHRSFIINLMWVLRLDRKTVRMANGKEIPLARGRFAEVSQAWLASRRTGRE